MCFSPSGFFSFFFFQSHVHRYRFSVDVCAKNGDTLKFDLAAIECVQTIVVTVFGFIVLWSLIWFYRWKVHFLREGRQNKYCWKYKYTSSELFQVQHFRIVSISYWMYYTFISAFIIGFVIVIDAKQDVKNIKNKTKYLKYYILV